MCIFSCLWVVCDLLLSIDSIIWRLSCKRMMQSLTTSDPSMVRWCYSFHIFYMVQVFSTTRHCKILLQIFPMIFGVIFDSNLYFRIVYISKSCFTHICDLQHNTLHYNSTFTTSLVHFKLDYWLIATLFFSISTVNSSVGFNSFSTLLVRAVMKNFKFHHIIPYLKSLVLLKITKFIYNKILSLTYESFKSKLL